MKLSRVIRIVEVLGVGAAMRLIYARKAKSGKVNIPVHGRDCLIRAGSSDAAVTISVLVDTDYARKIRSCCEHLMVEHVIDAGANIGVTTQVFSSMFPAARITAIEPDSDNFELLVHNTSGLKDVELIRSGLWSDTVNLSIANPEASSWSFQMEPSSAIGGIPAVTLMTLTRNDKPGSVFLKMDIEGAEKCVLEAIPDEVGERIGAVLIETHDQKEPGSGAALARFLSRWNMHVTVLGENILGYRPPR